MRYVLSGNLTKQMVEYLTKMPRFEPLDVLVSQLDRSSIKEMIEHRKNGIVKTLFIDSGAFSVHTGKAKVDIDEYIEYVNSIDEYIEMVAQVDTIPGTFGKAKSAEDYAESSRKSWGNFLYMYHKMKSPEKLVPVFHFGEPFSTLKNMLDWRDENGEPLTYVGISPANDTSQNIKNQYMNEVFEFIANSANPDVKAHLFGMTSLDALSKYPAFSADSVSHRLQAAYNKIFTPEFGTISLSKKSRASKTKSNMSFVDLADETALNKLKDYLASLNVTLEECQENHNARSAVCIRGILDWVKTHPYSPKNRTKTRKFLV